MEVLPFSSLDSRDVRAVCVGDILSSDEIGRMKKGWSCLPAEIQGLVRDFDGYYKELMRRVLWEYKGNSHKYYVWDINHISNPMSSRFISLATYDEQERYLYGGPTTSVSSSTTLADLSDLFSHVIHSNQIVWKPNVFGL